MRQGGGHKFNTAGPLVKIFLKKLLKILILLAFKELRHLVEREEYLDLRRNSHCFYPRTCWRISVHFTYKSCISGTACRSHQFIRAGIDFPARTHCSQSFRFWLLSFVERLD